VPRIAAYNQVKKDIKAMTDALDGAVQIEASSHGLSPRTNRLGDVAFDAA
jgi:hypothetical protein